MAKYRGIPKQKSVSARTAKPKPKIMAVEEKKRAVRIVKYTPKANVPQPPQLSSHISMQQIMYATPRDVSSLAPEIVIDKFQRTKTLKGFSAIKAVAIHYDRLRPDATLRPHEVTVIGTEAPGVPISKQKMVYCSCDCEDWCFRWEYAVAAHGGTRLLYGNGEAPNITNPQLAAGCCKHLYAVFKEIQRKKV